MCKSLRMRRSVNSAKRGLLHCFVIKPLIGPPSSYRHHMVVIVVVVVVVQKRRTKSEPRSTRNSTRSVATSQATVGARTPSITRPHNEPLPVSRASRAAPQHGSGKISPSLPEI
ncbi:hypothetical protein NHJ13734_009329 [Beauveria thailandica]